MPFGTQAILPNQPRRSNHLANSNIGETVKAKSTTIAQSAIVKWNVPNGACRKGTCTTAAKNSSSHRIEMFSHLLAKGRCRTETRSER